MTKKLYITTAIPYVNASPHIGFALEIIQADVIARYHRLTGNEVFFLTGTDENALKNVQAAEKEKITPKKLVDKYAEQFKNLKQALNLSNDDFIRTTEKRHLQGAKKFWLACQKDIYQKNYRGKYCLGCEEFKTNKDLVDGRCPEHPQQKLEVVEEENYFFALSKYEKKLKQLIEKDILKIIPQERKNEILAFINRGLEDFSISRSVKRAKGWGVPVPNDKRQIIYVWFDALINYLTGLGYGQSKKDQLFNKFWLKNNKILHCIGKGITRFHAIYWPAMLMSAGLPLPREELVHGYVTVEGRKISKSLGNTIDPFRFVKKFGSDALRYYLLKEIPPTKDGDFNFKHFKEVYNAGLANGLGNLTSRILTMVKKYSHCREPEINSDPDSHPLRTSKKIYNWKKAYKNRDSALKDYRFNQALEAIWKYISTADKYIDKNKPWQLAKKDKKKFNWIIYGLLDSLHQLAWMTYPFLPDSSLKIARALQIKGLLEKKPSDKQSWTNLQPGTKIKLEKPLFPRLN